MKNMSYDDSSSVNTAPNIYLSLNLPTFCVHPRHTYIAGKPGFQCDITWPVMPVKMIAGKLMADRISLYSTMHPTK